uniref:Uncharacterized protein n=1 Tax=Lutzomyia longipalpis TaxID=7200 RepID=A0A1B0CTK4_LUTLO
MTYRETLRSGLAKGRAQDKIQTGTANRRLHENVYILSICSHFNAHNALTPSQESPSLSNEETSYTSRTHLMLNDKMRSWWKEAHSFPFPVLMGKSEESAAISELFVSHKYIRWLCKKLVGGHGGKRANTRPNGNSSQPNGPSVQREEANSGFIEIIIIVVSLLLCFIIMGLAKGSAQDEIQTGIGGRWRGRKWWEWGN